MTEKSLLQEQSPIPDLMGSMQQLSGGSLPQNIAGGGGLDQESRVWLTRTEK